MAISKINFTKGGVLPLEEMLEVGKKHKRLVIGIPKDNIDIESRVSLTPEAVEILASCGHEIIIESGAGKGANYSDMDYSECGGFIINNRKEIFKADIVLKVSPFAIEDINDMRGDQLVISSLHITDNTKEFIKSMMHKKVTAISIENIKDETGSYPIERSMNAIAGNTSIIVAAEYLSNINHGKGVMLGGITGITPTEVVILGAGTAAEFAARAALGLGAFVKVFDDSLNRLHSLQDELGQLIYTSIYHPRVLEKALKSADVVIGAIPQVERGSRFYVSEEMVKGMKKGSVIVDISIDQGGCFETSELRTYKDPVYVKHDILHYCVPNLPSRVARSASIALSNIFGPLLQIMGDNGGYLSQIKQDPGLRNSVYIYNGILTNNNIGKYYDIPSQNIDLILAAF